MATYSLASPTRRGAAIDSMTSSHSTVAATRTRRIAPLCVMTRPGWFTLTRR